MVEFESSNFPLEKTQEEGRQFLPDRKEWIAISNAGVQIFRHGTSGGGVPTTLFAVPENQVLFITNAYLQVSTIAITGASCTLHINQAAQETRLIQMNVQAAPAGTRQIQTINLSFPMPIRVNGGDIVQVAVPSNVNGDAMIHGWVEPKVPTGIQQAQ